MEAKKKPTYRYEAEEASLKRYSVRLSFSQLRLAKKLGDGCLSKGIRLALEQSKGIARACK